MIEQGEIPIRDRRRCSRRVGRGTLALTAVACMLGASSCSAAHRPYASIVSIHERVLLVPQNSASGVGWCIGVVRPNGSIGESNCPSESGRLIVGEGSGEGGSPLVARAYALTAPQVAAVSVDGGPPIRTRSDPALPGGLRAVVVELRGLKGLLGDALRFTPLDAKGRPIPRVKRPGPPLGAEVSVRPLPNPAHPTSGACRIETTPLAGLAVQGGNLVTHVMPYRGLLGHPYLTCVSISYNVNGWPATASVLLDASDPGVPPMPLPGMLAVAGHSGIFRAPGISGEMEVRRIRGGWLSVSGTNGLQQRLVLLEHLSAIVRI